jgi:hypothetical protein
VKTAYLTATGLVPRRKTATTKRSSVERVVALDRSSLRPAPTGWSVVGDVAGASLSRFLMVYWLSSCAPCASVALLSFEAE